MIETILLFLAQHFELVDLLFDAITNKGVDHRKIVAAIKREMIEASDAQMRAELGGGK